MKLSIIVTTFNVEKYIEQCISTILSQINKEVELIIVDDASTDETVYYIAKSIKDNTNVSVVINTENKGVSYSRNVGLSLAKGDYVAFVDGDDFISLDYVKVLLRNCLTNKDYYVLSWASLGDTYVRYDSKRLPKWNRTVWSRVIKRDKIEHLFDESLTWGEDRKFIDENIKTEMTCGYIKEIMYYYRHMRKGSITEEKLGQGRTI